MLSQQKPYLCRKYIKLVLLGNKNPLHRLNESSLKHTILHKIKNQFGMLKS